MNPIDFIIIYLACGAPFGVYFYLQNRLTNELYSLWSKTFLVFVFWIPIALFTVYKSKVFKALVNNSFKKSVIAEVEIKDNLYSIQKTIEKIFLKSQSKISLFEFRQTIERYVGLTFSIQSSNSAKVSEQETEIFRVVKTRDIEISAACLNRRNRKRLAFHQTKARQDFLKIIGNLFDSISDTKELKIAVTEFVNLLEDSAGRNDLEKLFAANLQIGSQQTVKRSEKVLWKTQTPKPSPAQPISTRLQITTATTNSRSRD